MNELQGAYLLGGIVAGTIGTVALIMDLSWWIMMPIIITATILLIKNKLPIIKKRGSKK